MTVSSFSPLAERLQIFRLLAARGAVKLRVGLTRPFLALGQWRARQPERLLIAPPDIRTGDPTTAADIYAGYYAFAGKIVNSHGRSPFSIHPPSPEWARILHGFSWLRHLRAANSALARANARSLVKEFIATSGRSRDWPAWEPGVVARRTLSWLSQSPMLLEGVDYDDYRRFIRVLSRGYWLLRRQAHDELAGDLQLTAAIAMTSFALCAQGGAPLLKGAVSALNAQLLRQILLDGGPIGRNPQTLVDLLFDLLPLRQAFAARGMSPPPELLNAIDRMTPALRLFRHPEGALALFNGMGVTAPDRIAIALSYDDARGRPVFNARYSGYQRMEAEQALVIVDTGPPPPPLFSGGAHAGCLSFEFSLGIERIVVNCGSPGPRRPDLRASARTTAAHSTLTINDASSCLFSARLGVESWFDGEILAGPVHVPVTRVENAEGTTVGASHDGYQRRFGVIHERRLSLPAEGQRLLGRDRLVAPRGGEMTDVNYAIRFHIAPGVALAPIWEGQGVLLRTASGATLTFEAGGLPVDIEESIYFAAPEGPRACEQIVVYGVAADIDEVAWSFCVPPPQLAAALAVEQAP
ncbi:heparinase II/III family protein [uncultured Rhodoblastus sp.]|uniref:heparinase II/III family protein n=1 Tax=uncultured Rhodoblastus sp. TaxID=543037 RepID=UPI0025ED96AA|nr:heparinase II/III family protein [uncultured Rhodoblastus sp.]